MKDSTSSKYYCHYYY